MPENMKLNIKYFGLLAEVTGRDEEILDFDQSTVAQLLDILYERYPGLSDKDFQVAQNHEIASPGDTLSYGEIALLPPFSGG